MKQFYYENGDGKHRITLKKGCPEWVNSDCPDILYDDGSVLFHCSFNGVDDLPLFAIEDGTAEKLVEFIKASDKAFKKKYQWEEREGKTGIDFYIEQIEAAIERGYQGWGFILSFSSGGQK